MQRYKKVAVGGTFDHFHKGHEQLIKTALTIGEQVLIGLTTDTMLQTYPKPHAIQSYLQRKQAIQRFLQDNSAMTKARITPLNDFFGASIHDAEIEALVVSTETRSRAEEVNRIRTRKGFKPVQLVVIDMVLAQDGAPISSSRIRDKEVNRQGCLCTSKKFLEIAS